MTGKELIEEIHSWQAVNKDLEIIFQSNGNNFGCGEYSLSSDEDTLTLDIGNIDGSEKVSDKIYVRESELHSLLKCKLLIDRIRDGKDMYAYFGIDAETQLSFDIDAQILIDLLIRG